MGVLTKLILPLVCLLCVFGCASGSEPDPPILSSTSLSVAGESLGARHGTQQLNDHADDLAYGCSEHSPVLVGGGFSKGTANTYRFLNSIVGPQGQAVSYTRIGTCCEFESPNAPFDGVGLLEVYEISYEGLSEPKRLYFNWYDNGEPKIPKGLRARD